MIYALKLLFAALIAWGAGRAIGRRPFGELLPAAAYRHAWLLVALATIAAYLCKFPALFFIVFAVIAIYGRVTCGNPPVAPISVYLLLAIVVPPITYGVGGVGDINSLLLLDQYRLLAVVLLVPAAFRLLTRNRAVEDGGIRALDVCLLAYVALRILLRVPFSTSTNLLRLAVEAVLDTLVPYYVLTRSVRTLANLRFVVAYLAIGLLFAASIAVVECLLQHNLYAGLQTIYGLQWQLTYQLSRGGLLRVQAMTQQPILLAAAMVFLSGLWIWFKGADWRNSGFKAIFAIILIALAGTGSRGPWLACGLLFLMLLMMHRLSPQAVRILLIGGTIGAVALKAMGADQVVFSALSLLFGGTTEDMSTIDYRRQLLDDSLALIKQSPWLGVPDYASKLQSLRQGEGIIDIVNTYIAIMLNAGVVGLALYLLPYLLVIHRSLGAIRRDEAGKISRGSRFPVAFVAMTIAFMFMIFTSSSFGILETLMLLLLALPAAWLRLSEQERESNPTIVADDGPKRRGAAGHPFIRSRGA